MATEAQSPSLLSKMMALSLPETVFQAEYIWQDAEGGVRSKTATLKMKQAGKATLEDCKTWIFDGSSTGQAEPTDSDTFLKPVKVYQDPFRGSPHVLVLAECWNYDGTPNSFNFRHACKEVMDKASKDEPWFGFEQEYFLYDLDDKPYGWPSRGFPGPQGPYYCSSGAGLALGRDIVEAHYRACLHAGVLLDGINAEVAPAQWEFQVGPCPGIDLADEVTIARWILARTAEAYGAKVSYHPKPLSGDWNGSGGHITFSTAASRTDGGLDALKGYVEKLAPRHKEHMAVYGKDNELRMTGHCETAQFDSFTHGIADRSKSLRIPRPCELAGKGYFEDRRPGANVDLYKATKILVETTLL